VQTNLHAYHELNGLSTEFITGPPTHSVESQYCFALWHLSSSVVVCNTPRGGI